VKTAFSAVAEKKGIIAWEGRDTFFPYMPVVPALAIEGTEFANYSLFSNFAPVLLP